MFYVGRNAQCCPDTHETLHFGRRTAMSRKLMYLVCVVLVLGLGLTSPADAQEPGLVGWWRLDGNTNDSSGNNNRGTLAGNPQWVAGQIGDALNFDGASDHVDCGSGPSLDITGEITIAAWFYPTGSGSSTYPRIVDKSNGTGGADPGYKLYLRSAENYVFTLSAGGAYPISTLTAELNAWNYVAFITDGTQRKLFLNGAWQEWNETALPTSSSNPLFIGNSPAGARHFQGMIDDVRVYSRALTAEEVLKAMRGLLPPALASAPIPDEGATDVSRDVTLSWTPGEYAAAVNGHIVYLSENFDDVNDGVGGIRQSAGSYTPPQPLDFEKTYYWRVDEANAPPSSAVHEGEVWSFTTEPVAYPVQNIIATASSNDTGKGPENTVNGSGLDENDLHSIQEADMWLSGVELVDGAWIQYEFEKVYALHQMLVWNHNTRLESVIGFGIKESTIEYSVDGSDWIALGTTHEFARAPGSDGYAHNTTVGFGGVAAKYVRLTAVSNFGGLAKQYGLSEVRFFYKPLRARQPFPESGATDVDPDVTLSWRAGRGAARHDLYISTDEQAVTDGTASVTTVTEAGHSPLALDLGTTYFWKVNEVNMAETSTMFDGDVWSFTTPEFIVVEDFEDYNDYPPDEIFSAWIDGWGVPANGALAANDIPPFAETTIVHSGLQSMPFRYDNTGTATYSQAERTFAAAQDWTGHGLKTVSVWFYGNPDNVAGQMYVKVNGAKVEYDGDASNLARPGWQTWNIELASFGTDMQGVTNLAIGVDGSGASGVLYIDDIRLFAYERRFVTPTEPDTFGLAAHYKFDQNANDSSGNNNHGTLSGNPQWVTGEIGGALQFDGRNDYVDCGNDSSLNMTGAITISAWIYPAGSGASSTFPRIVDKSDGTGGGDPGYKVYLRAEENYVVTVSGGGTYMSSSSAAVLNAWNYVAFAITGTQWKLCLNGVWQEWDESTLPSLSSNPLFIGNSPAGERLFDGIIDDVRIYNRALTAAEIAWLAGETEPFEEPF